MCIQTLCRSEHRDVHFLSRSPRSPERKQELEGWKSLVETSIGDHYKGSNFIL